MELIAIWNVLRRYWLLIAIPAFITLLWTLPALPDAISPPETYGLTMRFSAAVPPDLENALAAATDSITRSGTYEDTSYVPWLASEYVVVNLPQWVTSSSFASHVSDHIREQDLDISTDDLRPAFNADSSRSILVVFLGWDDEAELEKIAAATITVLQTQNQEYFPQLATEPAQITPLDEIDVVRTTPPLTSRFRPFIRLLIGLAAGIGLAFLADYLDDTIRSTNDLEQLDVTVIGAVPKKA